MQNFTTTKVNATQLIENEKKTSEVIFDHDLQ